MQIYKIKNNQQKKYTRCIYLCIYPYTIECLNDFTCTHGRALIQRDIIATAMPALTLNLNIPTLYF